MASRQEELRVKAGGTVAEDAKMRPVAAFLTRLQLSEYLVSTFSSLFF
jgi:hypothetical protein